MGQETQRELNVELKPLIGQLPAVGPSVTRPDNPPPKLFPSAQAVAAAKTNHPAMDPIVEKELKSIREIILANPNDAIAVSALQERTRLISDEVKSLRDEIRELREQSKWYLVGFVTVLLGVLAAVVGTLQAFPKKSDA
jgi:hypothetical protein